MRYVNPVPISDCLGQISDLARRNLCSDWDESTKIREWVRFEPFPDFSSVSGNQKYRFSQSGKNGGNFCRGMSGLQHQVKIAYVCVLSHGSGKVSENDRIHFAVGNIVSVAEPKLYFSLFHAACHLLQMRSEKMKGREYILLL